MANSIGSTWGKWDLHVHTPASFVHNYEGTPEEAWEAFMLDLEALPEEFRVIGINDYLLVDGYERILKAKRHEGRLKNIDLVLPVVELRLDKFGGVLERDENGVYKSSQWTRVNAHVIFDQLEPELIRQQFLSAISPDYTLTPGSPASTWSGVISRESIEALGASIIHSVPETERGKYKSALLEGFNNLNVSLDKLIDAMERNNHLRGRCLLAIGRAEWASLRWGDNSVAEKKNVINRAQLVFTAAANPEAYENARNALEGAKVNAKLLDCSDAHSFRNSGQKDRIGNCFTWIKADPTFEGLLQAIAEFSDRVYVGDTPPKRARVAMNKTKFLKRIEIRSIPGAPPALASWFNCDIPLNPDLVAIIGNKGSGKSALADIIALLGCTKNHGGFSFLNTKRFRSVRARLATNFEATLSWADDQQITQNLSTNPAPTSVERVKYLPQLFLENLCNELSDGESGDFDQELRKIIFSHIPVEQRLGQATMDDYLDLQMGGINGAIENCRDRLAEINDVLLALEARHEPEVRRALDEKLVVKQAELAALEASPPDLVEDPAESESVRQDSKLALQRIGVLEGSLLELTKQEAELRQQLTELMKRAAAALRLGKALSNFKKTYEDFAVDFSRSLAELDPSIPLEAVVRCSFDWGSIDLAHSNASAAIEATRALLEGNTEAGKPATVAEHELHTSHSIVERKGAVEAEIEGLKARLSERQRLYVLYKEDVAKWERAKSEIIGAPGAPNTIEGIRDEISQLEGLPAKIKKCASEREKLLAEIHASLSLATEEYQRIYKPVQEFVKLAQRDEMELPLDFTARISEHGFEDGLLGRLNRQVRGSFSGVEESEELVRRLLDEADFSSDGGVLAFANKIDALLRTDKSSKTVRLVDQLKKGHSAAEVLNFIYGLEYLSPRYSLTYSGQEIGQLSPGERGLLLLVFYLLVDKDDSPLVIDQPEENLDNQTIFKVLGRCIKRAKERRQVIMVTHNPNLAVVCDAEQIIYASCDKQMCAFSYESGAIENPKTRARVVEVLEGTVPAFKNRQGKYRI